ncbi:MAG TPA: L,D-transpeptidase [Blastocatellia bacterium]|nr:L,D-transpeptidase [Blastocatellia bacterium]
MSRMMTRISAVLMTTILGALMCACSTASQNTAGPQTTGTAVQPTIEVTSVRQGEGSWKIATADTVTLTINAPGAKSAKVLYRPIVATDRHIVLKTVGASANGGFSSALKLVPDFAGDVWAEVSYPDGTTKETQALELASPRSDVAESEQAGGNAAAAAANANASAEESARSDKFTGGKIERASLQPGQGDIKITVNVPAFRMTLWQNGKEVKTYEIGVGMKKYPIVIGQRRITQVIWNPEWVPPDSEWVNESHSNVEPGEHVNPGDPRNPLGKIKIPLGDGFLMHEAGGSSDIGHLVSHGCIRMLKSDILDLATGIVDARALAIGKEQINRAMRTTDRLAAGIKPPIMIDINYDTIVVEGGVLHIYPDIYDRGTSTVENLRAELHGIGVDSTKLDDQTLREMLTRANPNEEFAVNVADIESGKAMASGANRPLTSQSVVARKQPASRKARRGAPGKR